MPLSSAGTCRAGKFFGSVIIGKEGFQTREEIQQAFQGRQDVDICNGSKDVLCQWEFRPAKQESQVDLVWLRPRDVGFPMGAMFYEFIRQVQRGQSLIPPPPEVAPLLLLDRGYRRLPAETILLGMTPIGNRVVLPKIFGFVRDRRVWQLRTFSAYPHDVLRADQLFLFEERGRIRSR